MQTFFAFFSGAFNPSRFTYKIVESFKEDE